LIHAALPDLLSVVVQRDVTALGQTAEVFRDPDNIQLELFVHPSAGELTGVRSDADSAEAQQALRQV
jgi:hypothetical protein